MSRILCTHPGRHGDILWALPTVRALARSYDTEIDLLLSPDYSCESFRNLLAHQPYVGDVLTAADWQIQQTAPITPRQPPSVPEDYDLTFHLAYEGWPSLPLPLEIYGLVEKHTPLRWPLDLDSPWIAASYRLPPPRLAVGFSDEHFELKYGLYWLLRNHFTSLGEEAWRGIVNCSGGPRWRETLSGLVSWETAAAWIEQAQLFVGCCSALHVLACGCGRPVVVVEPNPARHHPVFYPYDKAGGRVTVVLGLDGRPTVDSRHLIDAILAQLQRAAA
jgi:hypothetical protein